MSENFEPSEYQKAIFKWITDSDHRALVVEALAGSGKTTTLIKALDLIPKEQRALFLTFNAHIAEELVSRVPENVDAKTYHRHGNEIVLATLPKGSHLEKNKMYSLFKYHYPESMYMYAPINQIISLVKANLLTFKDEDLAYIVDRYDIELPNSMTEVFSMVQNIQQKSMEDLTSYTFDDMCWLPVTQNFRCDPYDFILIDEAQDTNKVQMQLALMSVKPEGRILAVGDRFQSIYAFRGADSQAIPSLIEGLKADTLPLSITYRCPKSHVEYCNMLFPNIPLEPSPKAKKGKIHEDVREEDFYRIVRPKDMVLCRTNAPLVGPAFELIRQGTKVTIRGKEIGKSLITILTKSFVKNIDELHYKVNMYIEREIGKLLSQPGKAMSIQMLDDKRATIFAIANNSKSLDDLKNKITTLFDDDSVPEVVFSTVHKAKGLEADNVFILEKSLMPHPKATLDWERDQEKNIMYVAFTRAKENLYFVKLNRRSY